MSKGTQRYSKETILSAIEKLKDGESLSSIARDMGLPKTTVKYWLDNAVKFAGESGEVEGANSKVVHLQNQIVDYGWRLLFKLYKRIQLKMKDAAFRDLVYGASELQSRLTQLRTLSGGGVGNGPAIMEVSEETKLTVRTFLEKKKQQENPAEEPKKDLTTAALELRRSGDPEPSGGVVSEAAGKEDGANG